MRTPHDPGPDDEPLNITDAMLHPEVDFERGMSPVPLVSVVVMVLCTLAYFAVLARGALDSPEKLVAVGALHRPEVARGEVWRLVSAMFLHGGPAHLLGNLAVLYILGMACEHAFGKAQFVTLYLASGVAGSLLSVTGDHVSVGASGAIFGLQGALVTFLARHRHRLEVRDQRVGFVLGFWALYSIALGFLNPFVDNRAHLGGLLAGALLGLVLRPALLRDRGEVARDPLTIAGLLVSLTCLAATAVVFVPRLLG
jgi:rhomboid protease GluP